MHNIKVPTFFLNAMDDPFIDPSLYPVKEIEANECLIFGSTNKGGHCSHMTGGFRPRQWFSTPLLEFFDFLETRERQTSANKVSY